MAGPLHTTLWTYPWDLNASGPDIVAHRLRNDIGLDAVSLAAVYHSFEMLRPHSRDKVLLQIPTAAIYFQPQSSLYADTAIDPHVSPLMGSANWYGEAAAATSKAGLELIAWTVFLHNSLLAGRHPRCAEVACTGDISTSRLCPANPDVRAYAIAISKDLTKNYGISMLECEGLSYGGFGHTHYHVKHGVELGAGGRFLMSLCFCPSCTNRAQGLGIDADVIRLSAEAKVRIALEAGTTNLDTPEDLISSLPGLEEFVRMREDVVSSLISETREAIGIPVSLIIMGSRHTSGIDRKRMGTIVDRLETLSYTSDPVRTERAISDITSDLLSPDQLIVGLQAYPPASPDHETLVANTRASYDLGIRRFSYYNFGIMPKPNLQWIKTTINAFAAP
ncbi:MAG: hypothetical protein CME25_23100 [Gemmatimonadetes bacterium]|nr:hypothetical protein [Gemmatimonadota bacterium]